MNVGGISPGYASIQQGFAQAGQRTLEAVESIVGATADGDIDGAVQGVLDLKDAKVQTQALAAVAKAQDKMLGSVLDLLA